MIAISGQCIEGGVEGHITLAGARIVREAVSGNGEEATACPAANFRPGGDEHIPKSLRAGRHNPASGPVGAQRTYPEASGGVSHEAGRPANGNAKGRLQIQLAPPLLMTTPHRKC